MYNLIPSCSDCNRVKSSQNVDIDQYYYPYYNNLDEISQFVIEYPTDFYKTKYVELKDIKVDFKAKLIKNKEFVDKHDKRFFY